jgi:hypothetical protein
MKSKVLGIVIILFIGIQFVPYGKDHSNPKSVAEPQWNTKKTRATFFKLCGAIVIVMKRHGQSIAI